LVEKYYFLKVIFSEKKIPVSLSIQEKLRRVMLSRTMLHVFVVVNPKSPGAEAVIPALELIVSTDPTRYSLFLLTAPDIFESCAAGVRDKGVSGCCFLAGGGDGTFAAVISILEEISCGDDSIPVAPFPLGTGNEASRVFGWGSTFGGGIVCSTSDALKQVLMAAANGGSCVTFDTWNVTSKFIDSEAVSDETTQLHKAFPWKRMICFTSVGFDAAISHKFTLQRERHPHRCNSVAKNKAWYGLYGAIELLRQLCFRRRLAPRSVSLSVDGINVEIPDCDSVQIFNIHSSADGIDFWGTGKKAATGDNVQDKDTLPLSTGDGYLEVVCTGGVADLLGIRLGMKHSRRLAQGRCIVMQLLPEFAPNGWDEGNHHRIPVQLDGETSLVDVACEIEICYGKGVPVILGPGDCLNAATGIGDETRHKPARWICNPFSFLFRHMASRRNSDCTEIKVH
jgi:diacylglycerol kinase family enzyme